MSIQVGSLEIFVEMPRKAQAFLHTLRETSVRMVPDFIIPYIVKPRKMPSVRYKIILIRNIWNIYQTCCIKTVFGAVVSWYQRPFMEVPNLIFL